MESLPQVKEIHNCVVDSLLTQKKAAIWAV